MYYLLTESFKSQEQNLVALIREEVPVQRIFMLGSALHIRRTESVFMPEAPSCKSAGYYYLLVLISGDENVNTIQDKIENMARQIVPVTVIVLPTLTFKTWLTKGHPFTDMVVKRAVLLYQSDEEEPVSPEILPVDKGERNDILYAEAYNKVTEFIAGADLYMIRKQTKLAAFMFHQAAEQCLHALFEIKTGMYLNTHNLDKLLRCCSMVCWRLPEIFPQNNKKEERLLKLLQKAYVGGRYENDYSITVFELEAIRKRIMDLKEVLHDFRD
jgi:HEPN domain-containing protein